MDGDLKLLFIGGAAPDLVALIFKEYFLGIMYKGVIIDPGSVKMRRSLKKHLKKFGGGIKKILTTHHHEEHVGNLEWLQDRIGVTVMVTKSTLDLIQSPPKIPFMRDLIIGQPEEFNGKFEILEKRVSLDSG
ncbi:MBL fold metallo-hydrolase, partial [Streptococcus pseudopneumoniae]|uniref:MBL fold metallo-hydrolase n=1 Tax=Streptococcus pseudopneumoniae TaxID=257758 RepID=UPI001486C19B